VRRRARRTLRAAPENGYGVSETPVVVEASREATVVVPRSARRHVSLVYTHRAASRERSAYTASLMATPQSPSRRAATTRLTSWEASSLLERAVCRSRSGFQAAASLSAARYPSERGHALGSLVAGDDPGRSIKVELLVGCIEKFGAALTTL
jgi:hypothetical protein